MKIKDGFTMRNIAGSNIVVPVGKTIDEFNGMITLNDSGAFFWECFEKDTTIEKVLEKVLKEYDVEKKKAKADIEAFVEILKTNNLLDE